jgi:uncharacterized membrane protein YozB (DUF420 family)
MSFYYSSKLNFRGFTALLVGICFLFLLIVYFFIPELQNGQSFFNQSYFQWSILISVLASLFLLLGFALGKRQNPEYL